MSLARACSMTFVTALTFTNGSHLASAQKGGRLLGRVVDSVGAPLVGVQVMVRGTAVGTTTSDSGRFALPLLAGWHAIVIRRLGYAVISDSIRMIEGGALSRDYVLDTRVRVLDPVEIGRPVSASMRAFEDRRLHQQGAFITSAELRDAGGGSLRSVLMKRLPGVLFVSYRNGLYLQSSRGMGSTDRRMRIRAIVSDPRSPTGCWLQVYLDGARYYTPTGQSDAPNMSDFQTRDLEAIEHYTGANTPPEFSTSWATCGTLVLWTRLP